MSDNLIKLTKLERRAAFSLAGIFSFRMLGLFMILPVFAIYAHGLNGATPKLIGLAMGIYGYTQALFQLPFGMLSDKFGRKRLITIGLVLFAIGSIIAALSTNIYGVILGRGLQGAGAVGSTIIALMADLTREENRTKAMAIIGMIIGLSFSVAMVLGPLLNSAIGVNGIFWVTAFLALGGILILRKAVPNPGEQRFHRDAEVEPAKLFKILTNTQLLRLDLGIFCLHAILTATFVVIPVALATEAKLPESEQWLLYLPVLVLSFLAMVPLIIIAEKKRKIKPIFNTAIALIVLSELVLALNHYNITVIAISLFCFFTAFTSLEATLPSLISKIAPAGNKGTAMGVYSFCQFFGIGIGGTIAGWLYGQHHLEGVFIFAALLGLLWLLVAITMPKPKHLGTFMLKLEREINQEALSNIDGVEEVVIMQDEGVAYLKVDNAIVDKNKLMAFAKKS